VKKILFSMLVVLVSIALVLPAAVLADTGASIWTDKEDYAPEEVVTISGSGFLVDTEVTITVERPDGVVVTVDASTDDAGSFACTYQLDGIGGTYLVTATDGTSTATTTFEDAVTISGVYSSNSTGSPKSTFLTTDDVYASVNTSGGSGANNIRLYVLNDVPSDGENLDTTSKNVLGGYVSAAPDTQPSTFTYMVWHLPTAGTYYIVADGGNGRYGGGDVISVSFNVTGGAGPQETADVTFNQTGVGTDFTGTVVTINGTAYNVTDLPVTITQGVGLNISFAYSSPLGVDGKQYVWTNTTGGLTTDQSGNITVASGGGNVIGNYKTQYYLTLVTDPPGLTTPSGEGWYDAGTSANISTTSPVVNSTYTYFFAGWTTCNMSEIAEQYALNTTVLMDEAKTVTANYQAMTAGTGGKTLGFWSNKNGQALIGSNNLTMLRGLNLKNKNDSAFDPTTNTQLKNWLLKADAVNMAYMLSAQLAATELSVYNGLLNGSQLVWVDDGDGIFEPGEAQSINSIMTAANTELGTPTTREYQEYLKNLLDDINNNLLWFVV
jgi:hypothetical protein